MARDEEAQPNPEPTDDPAGRIVVPADPSDGWGDGDALRRDDGTDDFDRVNDWSWDVLDVHHPGFSSPEDYEANRDAYRQFLS